jgi:DNA-binding response OmpR family regulator
MTILVVEDSRFLQLVIERVLVKAGYRVLKTSDGEDGSRVAREKGPDLNPSRHDVTQARR